MEVRDRIDIIQAKRDPVGEIVKCYVNLTKKCISCLACSNPYKGYVIAHRQAILLNDCEFIVNERARQRVLREKKKYVHAFVKGRVVAAMNFGEQADFTSAILSDELTRVYYDPYAGATFVQYVDWKAVPVTRARQVLLTTSDEGKVVCYARGVM